MAEKTRQSGHLQLVTKRSKGRSYPGIWRWRSHRQGDTGWETVDIELGRDLSGLRSRVLVALGELKAERITERWIAWAFRDWRGIPPWTGRPESMKASQVCAWWVTFPSSRSGSVRLRFRALSPKSPYDFRYCRHAIADTAERATRIWQQLVDDPVADLGRLQWLEQQAEKVIAELSDNHIGLRRQYRRGDLSKRDFDADEREVLMVIDEWETGIGEMRSLWDKQLADMVAAMPRTRREQDRRRIIALADRHFNSPRLRQEWELRHWQDNTLVW